MSQWIRGESSDSFLDLDIFNLSGAGPGAAGGGSDKAAAKPPASRPAPGSGGGEMEIEEGGGEDNAPLFWQPGKRGFYWPCLGRASAERLNAFHNVGGRMIGLCLLHNKVCPLSLCRLMLKYLVGRRLAWHNLAFLDGPLYESLRSLLPLEPPAMVDSLDLYFCVQLAPQEGGEQMELIPGGAEVAVTANYVHNYVRKYALHRMLVLPHKALKNLRGCLRCCQPRRWRG